MTRPTHRTARRTLTAVALSAAALTGPAASATVVALPVTAGVTGAAGRRPTPWPGTRWSSWMTRA
ncbi:hypothetical protein SAMN04487849_1287 [Micrococcus luteus]|uniref:Uncharacterized protein n=1 Tax=Micrococcus luteus TaxID=1270 RepID=A0ABD7MBJ3_MICLU|nr:hypothetical protein [Micrococcus luteus]SHL94705.1 hypothetical protein SAMN04487849_1287 [Micrococcus luteus]